MKRIIFGIKIVVLIIGMDKVAIAASETHGKLYYLNDTGGIIISYDTGIKRPTGLAVDPGGLYTIEASTPKKGVPAFGLIAFLSALLAVVLMRKRKRE